MYKTESTSVLKVGMSCVLVEVTTTFINKVVLSELNQRTNLYALLCVPE